MFEPMIDHLSLGITNLDRSIEFYRRTFEPLGIALQHSTDVEASFGAGSARTFWLYPAQTVTPVPGMHIAFTAASTEAVDRAHKAACAAGGSVVREPSWRPEISDEYYGSVVLDPDGHKLEIVAYGMM
jgi:catechol 2,3-dioxygenase-like lactoylglutathione lyase family enzyme